jgi:hypothetical protein
MPNNFAGAPPPAPAARKDVIRITSAEATQFICLSASFYGQWTHWAGGRTQECTKDRNRDCDGCRRGFPSKWKGYLHVSNGSQWDGFLELTPTAAILLNEQTPTDKNLRGMVFRIRRTKGGAKGRYIVEVLERRVDETELVDAKDPYETLRFLWSCKRPSGQPTV